MTTLSWRSLRTRLVVGALCASVASIWIVTLVIGKYLRADMEAAIQSARATTLHAARLRDAGRPFSREASIAKLVATDHAMKVTTDAVQVLGGYGYTRDFPVERYMREAKVMQIFEGTNQIQRMVISRSLDKGADDTITVAR